MLISESDKVLAKDRTWPWWALEFQQAADRMSRSQTPVIIVSAENKPQLPAQLLTIGAQA